MDRATPTPHPPARVKSLVACVGVPTRDLEDVMQDAMVRLWERREQVRAARNPGAFRDSVVLNTARDHRRGARRREEALTGFDEAALRDERPSPEEHAIARQEAALVRELIDQIGERHRGVFIACELLERPIAEVAREQEIPLETARSRLRRAWEEFDEAAARWASRQRGRGARRLRAVLFPPWLFARRWPWRDGPTRSMTEGVVIAFAAALAVLVTSHAEPAGPVQIPMAALVSTAITPPGAPAASEAEAASEPAEATSMSARPAHRAPVKASLSPAAPEGRPARPRPAGGSRERDLVARARTAVEAGDIASLVEARRLLEEHGRRFPRGRLATDREALLDRLR
ncbi:RNA polymerase sigma factor [Sorangium sp. So ce1078]|uniref:RNA polymerase sigma factor n=1 Tax=Sorangium sp. So ce1078 TaxID=3133329 RepID=UPI003F616B6F